MRVRRTAIPVLLWCLATAASIAVASTALRPVMRTAMPSDSLPAVGEARGPGDLIPQQGLPSTGAASQPSPSLSPAPPGSTSTTQGPATGAPTSRPATPTTRATTAPVSRIVGGWTVTADNDGVDTYLRSFRSEGGDAVIRIRSGAVSLVTASPRDGYSVSKSQTEPTRLVVQFVNVGGNSAYLVDAMWWNDAPYGEVTRIGT